MRKSCLGILTAVLIALSVRESVAYNLFGRRWPNPTTTFYVNIPGADGLWDRAFEGAMSKWNGGTGFGYNIMRGTYWDPCTAPGNNPKNGVKFSSTNCGDSWGATTLAVTRSWSSGTTLAQAGIVFNSTKSWSVYDAAWNSSPGDFQRVAVHELGHALGLDHEDSVPAIMKTFVSDITDPQIDDINGVNALYGTSRTIDTTAPSLTITSPSDGQTVSTSSITVSGTAADAGRGDSGISSVTVNGVRAAGDTASGSASAFWSRTITLNNGQNTVEVIARDNSPNQNAVAQSVRVNFQPITPPPPPVGGESLTLFIPIVLSSSGLNNSFFTSELTLTNRGSSSATLNFTYTAAFGGGTGSTTAILPAGRQQIFPDAIAYLKTIGIPIPDSGNRGGSLVVRFSGLSSPSDAAVTVRTTTAVAGGRAGLAYAGISTAMTLTEPSYLCGLRQNATDRSNVAIQNAGALTDGNITLRLTLFDGESFFSQVLAPETLSPGEFRQISGILATNGVSLRNGYVRIERISGTARYYAYGVINDQFNSDGSFVPPIPESSLAGRRGLTLPVLVETDSFSSELILTNWSNTKKTVLFDYVADAVQTTTRTASFQIEMDPRTQEIYPNFVQVLRQAGILGIGPAGPAYVGSLFAWVDTGDISGIMLGARTSTPGAGGRFGLFYTAVPTGTASTTSAWLYGLQQDNENRTNIALVNTGEVDGNADDFRIELYDGDTGVKVNTVQGIRLNADSWRQFGSILVQYAPGTRQGYARITRTAGANPFIAYAVVNDGGQPGQRSGDGAFISSSP